MNTVINILVFKMLSMCGISRMFDDLLVVLQSKHKFYLLEWRSRAQYTQKLENFSFVKQIMTNAPVIRVWMGEPVSTPKKIYLRLSSHAERADIRWWVWFFDLAIMVIELSGVQFGLKPYAGFQNWTSAQLEFDLKSQVWVQTKIARPEVQLPLY